MSWIRARFALALPEDQTDYRPITFPPPGPYWCTGYDSEGRPILVAYVKSEDQIKQHWPEALEPDCETKDEIEFTSRFPQPKWWNENE